MMSYDPSSLNRNKTLLEAIEEVKKFLIANPCYKVFYANTNYLVGTTTYSKTYIDDADSIAEYDVVFFNNNYYGKVESVGDSTFTIIGATNFKGDTGAQGTPGTPGTPGADGQDGADGISITNVSIDASKHLICTLSDGNTIDAGEIPTIIHYVQVSNASGTLTDAQYSQVLYRDSIIDYVGTILQKYAEDVNEIIFQCLENDLFDGITKNLICTITKLTKAYSITEEHLKIADDSINSESATSGQVLTADGTGGASWETPSSGTNVVANPTLEGTESALTGIEVGTTKYKVKLPENMSMADITANPINTARVVGFDSSGNLTKYYIMSTNIKGNGVDGAVLTSDSNGGAVWKIPSNKYVHNIRINNGSNIGNTFIQIITPDSTPYTTLNELYTGLASIFSIGASYIRITATGNYTSGAVNYPIFSFIFNNTGSSSFTTNYIASDGSIASGAITGGINTDLVYKL